MAGEMCELKNTPIGEAIDNHDIPLLCQLMKEGEDIPKRDRPVLKTDRKGNTFLHYVSSIHRPYVPYILLKAGIEINVLNRDGNTALHVSALSHECCHMADLMAAGIDPYIKNNFGKTAADIASGKVASDMSFKSKLWVDLFKKYEPGLRLAIERHDLERVEYLLHCWSACHYSIKGRDMRQWAAYLTYHDIVKLLDKHRFSILAVCSIYENDLQGLEYALSRGAEMCNVNYLQELTGSHPHHMLQHAIRLNSIQMVEQLCEAGADVNVYVHVKEYFRGPLFFETIRFYKEFDFNITRVVLSNADVNLKDERGRTSLMYSVDSCRDTECYGERVLQLVVKQLENGADIAIRDNTGCTIRTVALFARRHDIVSAVDKHLVNMIKKSQLTDLQELAVEGYDDFNVTYNYRDTWVYAAGNETEDVKIFLENLPKYQDEVRKLHAAIANGDYNEVQRLVEHCGEPRVYDTEMIIEKLGKNQSKRILKAIEQNDVSKYADQIDDCFKENHYDWTMLLRGKDKGGRSPLLKAILYGEVEITRWILNTLPDTLNVTDNCLRTPSHYARAHGESGIDLVDILVSREAVETVDCEGNKPGCLPVNFIENEQKAVYGLQKERVTMSLYEELLGIIRDEENTYDEFIQVMKQILYPISKLSEMFHPHGHPLVSNFECPLIETIKYGRIEMAKRLVKNGCSLTDKHDIEGDKEMDGHRMNAIEFARYKNLHDLVKYMEYHNSRKHS